MTKPFYFIRHGQTDWNLKQIYMGQKDIPLNETGIKQAADAARILSREMIAHIFTSPLQRAQETARLINLKLNMVRRTPSLFIYALPCMQINRGLCAPWMNRQ